MNYFTRLKEDNLFCFTLCLVTFFAVLMASLLPFVTTPWVDEVGTSDAAIAILNGRAFHSHVWPYSYNPLHFFVLTIWLSLVGVSHFSVCALNIVIHVITSLYLVALLRKWDFIKSKLTILLLLSLLWGGFSLLGIVLNGRIDTLTLLTVIFLVDCLTREKCSYSLLFVSAFLTFGAAVYHLPPVIFGLGVLFLFPFAYLTRKEIFKRGFLVAFAFGLAFLSILIFYYFNQSLLRFVNTYISFSATASGKERDLINEIIAAYTLEKEALFLFLVVFLTYLWSKHIRRSLHLPLLCLIGAFPLIMVLAGRYVAYYSWIFYLPSLLLFVFVYTKITSKKLLVLIPIFSFLFALFVSVFYIIDSNKEHLRYQKIEQFVNSLNYSFIGRNVVFSNHKFYYFIINKNAIPWNRSDSIDLSPKEKFKSFVKKIAKTKEREDILMTLFDKIQYVDISFPNNGLILTSTKNEFKALKSRLEQEDYHVEVLVSKDEFKLSSFSK